MHRVILVLLLLISNPIGAQNTFLIPMPKKLEWTNQPINFLNFQGILFTDSSLQKEAHNLQKQLVNLNWPITNCTINKASSKNLILLKLNKTGAVKQIVGSYQLTITKDSIKIISNSKEGIHNGTQTLLQLANTGKIITCKIEDWPAFAWRGFMVDVGRNYLPVSMLKHLIDNMAFYKLNVFHFHATEDIAWRFEIKQYPQLTDAENMLRNKGMFYTIAEIKELIAYCKERSIKFIPEIDMPGHSAAFKRAMNCDMQSEEGITIIKNILKEICDTYDIEYIHIGADEVKINNKEFIPKISSYIQGLGKKIIGWQPGGNFTNNTIRQLWMDDQGKITNDHQIKYLDSRHLYINHMDPLESVTSIYNRQIANKDQGDSNALGGILCLWHDRNVTEASDLFRMNPVYPSMLAFAERCWVGGGTKGWIANINDGDINGFIEFEQRLMNHQKKYFSNIPFPYSEQSNLKWTLLGPYKNEGILSAKFAPEYPNFKLDIKEKANQNIGGTIVLKHWWAPLIKGAINNPKDSTTWYVTTSIWSDSNKIANFWIGFNNLSRSPATDTPPENSWDEKQSCIWVNNQIIPAPKWKFPGRKGNSEDPLVDEGYEYRIPTKIQLQKGWNKVLIKCPIGSFKGKNWQNPVKWMFTFIAAPNISE